MCLPHLLLLLQSPAKSLVHRKPLKTIDWIEVSPVFLLLGKNWLSTSNDILCHFFMPALPLSLRIRTNHEPSSLMSAQSQNSWGSGKAEWSWFQNQKEIPFSACAASSSWGPSCYPKQDASSGVDTKPQTWGRWSTPRLARGGLRDHGVQLLFYEWGKLSKVFRGVTIWYFKCENTL